MMRYYLVLFLLPFLSCKTGNLKVIADLPIDLIEVSGIAIDKKNDVIWMVNDSGNKARVYGVDTMGTIKKVLKIDAKNRDWEDLTMDLEGNLYIGNFGNNDNDSKALSIYIIKAEDLASDKEKLKPEIISFSYPEQEKFPPKKNRRHFDCESFFYFQDSLYLFTKSRVAKAPEKTNLYKLPAQKGTYQAQYVSTFETCEENECWVTSADISADGKQLALLTENSVFVFSNLNQQNFFSSPVSRYTFDYDSQKESVAFKNDSILYVADEYLGTDGGNLYEFKITDGLKPKP